MSDLPGIWQVQRAASAIGGALRRRSRRGVVLLYHRVAGPRFDPQLLDVSPQNFDAQMRILAQRTEPLALREFELRRRAGTLPARAVAVTFDDGYVNNLHVAVPLLNVHGIPATVFVAAGMIGTGREFWWDDIERIAFSVCALLGAPPALLIPWSVDDGAPYMAERGITHWNAATLADSSPRCRLYRAMVGASHRLPSRERDQLVSQWRAWAGVADVARESHRTMTTGELVALSDARDISIGAHTMTHPSLAVLSAADQERELFDSRRWLEATIAKPVTMVAYPYGEAQDVSAATVGAAQSAGFDFGMANIPGTAWRWSSRWRVPRMLVRDWDATTFAARVDAWFTE